jgi:tRNA (cytidine32/uridine32-2'-O)-methyltransferase
MSVLNNIRIVLVRTTHPGNIGAAARAMKNMALHRLMLVEPLNFPHPDATARAAGAEDVLDRAVVCNTLDVAVADCALVIGTSARARRIGWPTVTPDEAARALVAAAGAGPVAVVFGQERTGLLNEDLDRCRTVVSIPVNEEYPSLNLGSAVQILAYEIFRAAGAVSQRAGRTDLAGHDDMRRFFHHLEAVLVDIGFLVPENPRYLMRRLMRLFHRAEPDRNELNILRGILTAVQTPRRSKLDSGGDRSA